MENLNGNSNDIEENDMILVKKKASASFKGGRITIPNTRSDYVSPKQNDIKLPTLDEKGLKSDLKRKQSLKQMKDKYNNQKNLIKQALCSTNNAKSKKIVFDCDSDLEDRPDSGKVKLNIFDEEESDGYENAHVSDFRIKEHFQGEQGKALMKLQAKYNLDKRFQLDSNFLDPSQTQSAEKFDQTKDLENSERDRQMDILSQVLGKQIDTRARNPHNVMPTIILRFDPQKEEHRKFLRKKNDEPMETEVDDQKINNFYSNETGFVNDAPEVSTERVYNVSANLKNLFQNTGNELSILTMFRNSQIDKDKEQNAAEHEVAVDIPARPIDVTNPFKYDSSSSEDEGVSTYKGKNNIVDVQQFEDQKPTKHTEKFFIYDNDDRLSNGALFFHANNIDALQDYSTIRSQLSKLIKKKIAKTKNRIQYKKKR